MADVPNAASVALIDNRKVLLIQRARPPYRGLWTLPGGRLEPGEDAAAGAAREVREELGVRVAALRPVMRLSLGDTGYLLQVMATDDFQGPITPGREIAAHRWIDPRSIGELATTPNLDEVLARVMALFGRG